MVAYRMGAILFAAFLVTCGSDAVGEKPNPSIVDFDGGELLDGDNRPEILVERALKGWPQDLLSATAQDWTILKKHAETTTIQVLVTVRVDLEKYGKASQQLSDVLDRVASHKTELAWRPKGHPYNMPAGQDTIETDDHYTEHKTTRGWDFTGLDPGILPQSEKNTEHTVILLRPTRANVAMLRGKRFQLESTIWSYFVGLFAKKATVLIELLDGDGQIVSAGKIGYDSTCSLRLKDILLQTACGTTYNRVNDGRWSLDHSLHGDFGFDRPDSWTEHWKKDSPVVISPLLNCTVSRFASGFGLLSVVTFKVPIDVPTSELPAVKKIRCTVETTKGTVAGK
jgi:hypothetical protein